MGDTSGESTPLFSSGNATPRWTGDIPRPPFVGATRLAEFETKETINQGTYGMVYKAIEKKTGRVVALKRLKLDHEKDGVRAKAPALGAAKFGGFMSSGAYLDGTLTTNVARLGNDGGVPHLVFEYMDYDLARILPAETGNVFPLVNIQHFSKQLLEGLFEMHKRKTMHRDIKHSTDLKFTPKVCTLWYRPPELLLGDTKYTTAIDMWGAGCIIGEFFTRVPLFRSTIPDTDDTTSLNQLDLIANLCGSVNPETWQAALNLPRAQNYVFGAKPRKVIAQFETHNQRAAELLDGLSEKRWVVGFRGLTLGQHKHICLQLDPTKRFSAKDALDHLFFWENEIVPDLNARKSHTGAGHADAQAAIDRIRQAGPHSVDSRHGVGHGMGKGPAAGDRHFDDRHKDGAAAARAGSYSPPHGGRHYDRRDSHKREYDHRGDERPDIHGGRPQTIPVYHGASFSQKPVMYQQPSTSQPPSRAAHHPPPQYQHPHHGHHHEQHPQGASGTHHSSSARHWTSSEGHQQPNGPSRSGVGVSGPSHTSTPSSYGASTRAPPVSAAFQYVAPSYSSGGASAGGVSDGHRSGPERSNWRDGDSSSRGARAPVAASMPYPGPSRHGPPPMPPPPPSGPRAHPSGRPAAPPPPPPPYPPSSSGGAPWPKRPRQ